MVFVGVQHASAPLVSVQLCPVVELGQLKLALVPFQILPLILLCVGFQLLLNPPDLLGHPCQTDRYPLATHEPAKV
jgi:hypothetical protein